MDGMLSQEEINALLSGMTADSASDEADSSAEANPEVNTEEPLTPEEKDAIGEVANISMGTAATTLFALVNNVVNITVPTVSYATWDDLVAKYDRPCVFVQLSYKEGIEGNNVLILKEQDVKIITDLMMGGDGLNVADELTDLHLSAISEAMNQMMGSSATSLSSMLGRKIDIRPPTASLVDLDEGHDSKNMTEFLTETFVKVTFNLEIGSLIDSEIMQLYPIALAKDIYQIFTSATDEDSEPVQQEQVQSSQEPIMANPVPGDMPMDENSMGYGQPQQMGYGQPQQMGYGQPQQMGYGQPQQMGYGQPQMMGGFPGQPMMAGPDVNAQPVQFQPFSQGANPVLQQENIDLIKDVPLEVTVELGRTKKSIKDILATSPGTIIELDKIAGEPVDVLVNGKFVAKGEVVVIEESFGVRVTEIIK